MKKRDKAEPSNKLFDGWIRNTLISSIFGTLMVLLMVLYSKYYYIFPMGFMRFILYDLTIFIPIFLITLFGYLFKLGQGVVTDNLFLVLSFVIYSISSFITLALYGKQRENKKRKYINICLIILGIYLVLSLVYHYFGVYH